LEPELEKRLEEAKFVNQWAEKLLERSPETLVIIAGDINSGYESEVSDALAGNSFIDTASQLPAGDRFSILNDGLAFLFDHILVSDSSIGYKTSIFHLNSLFDAESSASDHDPVLIAIDLPGEGLYR
jgi:predicted extracellular nuclease